MKCVLCGLVVAMVAAGYTPASSDGKLLCMIFVRAIDRAAAAMFALQHEVLPAQHIPAQGAGREPYRS